MRRFVTGGTIITVLGILALVSVQMVYKATIVDEPDPAGLVPMNIQNALDFLDGREGHGILFPDTKGVVVAIETVGDPWERMDLHTVLRGTKLNLWLPNDDGYTSDDATDSDEECQDYVNTACAEAGFGTGQPDMASVGDPDENNCQTCLGPCTAGCNDDGECPYAGVTQCSD